MGAALAAAEVAAVFVHLGHAQVVPGDCPCADLVARSSRCCLEVFRSGAAAVHATAALLGGG
jgi:hypothetical protein